MKVAIFGGSFNPVHNEHVKVALGAVEELFLDKLIIMPTFVSPHKQNAGVISSEHRLNMLKIAFNGCSNIEVSDFEIKKGGVSYTYQTVEHFKDLYKDAKLYFMMGSDMLENFPTWKNPQIICDNSTLLLTERRNGEFDDNKLINKVETLYKTKIQKLSVYGEKLSSTKIRVYKKLGLSLEGLVPKQVEDYIDKNNIYPPDKYYDYIKRTLPKKRLIHTAGVILTALDLSKRLGVDLQKAELSALLHDVAKYKNPSDYKDFIIPSDIPKDIEHQFLGEYIAKNELGVEDEAVLSAIKYHTTGRGGMSDLEKVIYIADLIEPSRKFLGVDSLRQEINKDFNKGFKICLEEIVEFLIKSGKEVYLLTKDALKGE